MSACKGMNCGCTDGVSHSVECRAEYAQTIERARFEAWYAEERKKCITGTLTKAWARKAWFAATGTSTRAHGGSEC